MRTKRSDIYTPQHGLPNVLSMAGSSLTATLEPQSLFLPYVVMYSLLYVISILLCTSCSTLTCVTARWGPSTRLYLGRGFPGHCVVVAGALTLRPRDSSSTMIWTVEEASPPQILRVRLCVCDREQNGDRDGEKERRRLRAFPFVTHNVRRRRVGKQRRATGAVQHVSIIQIRAIVDERRKQGGRTNLKELKKKQK